MKITFSKRSRELPAVFLVAGLVLSCQSSDVIAPDGSTISLNANPAVIVLSGGVQSSPVTLIATVSNSMGVPLPGQDVRFTTSSGVLTPTGGLPVRSDEFGNATSILTGANTTANITAKSGKATATLQIQTATCTLSSISFGPSPLDLETCNDTFTLTANAVDTSGAPCGGILINFSTGTGATDVGGSFNPPSKTTNVTGDASTTFTVSTTDCNSKCVGKSCTANLKACSGSTCSTPIIFQPENVP